mgnify:CR=1 FL=1
MNLIIQVLLIGSGRDVEVGESCERAIAVGAPGVAQCPGLHSPEDCRDRHHQLGTGKDDTIYAGSGNDTVKGNGGDDTIYGGSGSDTINGNNDNDTIVGGFGADNLTGGNGNDRFVYLSVADSNATRFDTITDFQSRSDTIDLTALGALTFLALTSTSTTVPPHTIAWICMTARPIRPSCTSIRPIKP